MEKFFLCYRVIYTLVERKKFHVVVDKCERSLKHIFWSFYSYQCGIFTARKQSCGKVMFLQACVILFTGGRTCFQGACMLSGGCACFRGGHVCFWGYACFLAACACFWGVCMPLGGVCQGGVPCTPLAWYHEIRLVNKRAVHILVECILILLWNHRLNRRNTVTGPPGALLFDRDQRSHWKNHFNCCYAQVATWAFIAQISYHRCSYK